LVRDNQLGKLKLDYVLMKKKEDVTLLENRINFINNINKAKEQLLFGFIYIEGI
jgi:hypothetical protein